MRELQRSYEFFFLQKHFFFHLPFTFSASRLIGSKFCISIVFNSLGTYYAPMREIENHAFAEKKKCRNQVAFRDVNIPSS